MKRFLFLALLPALPARAENLQYLDHAESAISALSDNVANAKSTIDLTYFIWDPCSSVTKVLTKALREKAKSGVKVRVMLDSFSQRKYMDAMTEDFAASGMQLKFYGANEPLYANFHSHSKMTLVDANVPGKSRLLSGGRNISDDYFGMEEKNYVDRDVNVTGAGSAGQDPGGPVASAESGFDRLWRNPLTKHVGPATAEQRAKLRACQKWTAKDAALEKFLKANAARVAAAEKPVSCPGVRFTIDDMRHVTNAPNGAANAKDTSREVYALVAGAKRSLTLENQYFIPDSMAMGPILAQKRAERVKIDVYSNGYDADETLVTPLDKDFELVGNWNAYYLQSTNGGSETNHMNFRIAGLLDRWQFSPPRTRYHYHAKDFVADGKNTIVGSFNIDPRSMNINGESGVSVRNCLAFARKVEGVARLTGREWDLEEKLRVCQGGSAPAVPLQDPLSALLGFVTKDLQ